MGANVCYNHASDSTTENILIIDKMYKQFQIQQIKEKSQMDGLDEFELNKFIGDVHYIHAASLQSYDRLSCFDGRGFSERLGSPGGDSSLFLLGLTAYEELSQKQLTQNQIKLLMDKYLQQKKQPMYMHSDFNTLEYLFQHLNKHCSMKWEMQKEIINASPQLQTQLIPLLTKPEYIGCGHLKLTISNSQIYLTRKQLVEYFILYFFELLWNQDKRVCYEILDGDHNEKAVCIFNENSGSNNKKQHQIYAPLIRPFNQNQNQSCFVYHQSAEEKLRQKFSLFLQKELGGVDSTKLFEKMKEIGQKQLEYTTGKLASKLPVYTIKFT